MKPKKMIKQVGYKTPILKGLLNERDHLKGKVATLTSQREEANNKALQFEKKLNRFSRELVALKDPMKSEQYEYASNPLFHISEDDIAKSKKASTGKYDSIQTSTWFVPYFENIAFGGLYTIFRLINKLGEEGVDNHVVIYGSGDKSLQSIEQQIKESFPNSRTTVQWYDTSVSKIEDIPPSDIAFCTHWISAYLLLRYNQTKRKFYMIQDYEPIFYAAGTIGALAESTYRFGFYGIVNTPGLERAVKSKHKIESVSFMPSVDRKTYYPLNGKSKKGPVRIFFYARPGKERNGFNLGVETIRLLKERYRDDVEIVTAGANWNEDRYGLAGLVNNVGMLTNLKEIAQLYRSCDICFSFMFTRHPSYQPFEFMASGVCYVSNVNEDNEWFLKDRDNCILTEPSPLAMSEAISLAITDEPLRAKLVKSGLDTVSQLAPWDEVLENVWREIKNA